MSLAVKMLGGPIVKQAINYMDKNPEENLVKLLNLGEKVARREGDKKTIQNIKNLMSDPENVWYKYAMRLLKGLDKNVKHKLGINFFINSALLGVPKQWEISNKHDINVPYATLIDPTSACNLKCTGCWAGEYAKTDSLDNEVLDRVIREGKELGIYLVIFSGGEPLVRKNDLIKLAEKHSDVQFLAFTNGTLIDDEFIDDLVRVGNFALAFSLEGLEEATDARRGKGVFNKVITNMEKMRDAGLVFGCSTCYTRHNVDEVTSDEYLDLLVEKGCVFLWYFTYVPVGIDPNLDLMATPEQRKHVFEKIQHFRQTKPIFTIDFWNDGEFSGGCIAGGRRYFHINARGDVEPCAFIHYATCNIKDTSLFDALHSPLFKAYRKGQPFNDNMFRPCPLIDNPQSLNKMVEESKAYSTQVGQEYTPKELADMLDEQYANKWGEVADDMWEERHPSEQ
ncbi:MAG: radical SAM protein [Clostridia bacterium]|nr:radical SAM protein [Clostridia bacterium]